MYVLKKLSTKLAAPVEADMEMLRYVGKYLKGTPDLALIHKRSYPGKSFSEMRNRGTDDEDVERDNYKVPALIEVISDSDWAADRESRQSVSCGVIMVNGNLVHFQSKRQKSVALSSCEAEAIAATSILSEGVFLKGLLERILGVEPRLVLFSDSSSSRQLIARKGLGKARHLDVDLLRIQRIPKLIIKAIKGKDNPSDLGTKSLTRDKIKKYMVTLGYVGEYLDQEAQEAQEEEGRRVSSRSKMSFDEKTVTRMIQAVTTAVLISLAEAQREDEEGLGSTVSMWMNCMVSVSLFICVAAAIFQIKPLQRSSREGKRRKEEKEEKRKKRKMASDDDLKKLMGNAKSIASVSFVERQLKKKIEERCSVAEGEDQVKELNKQREGHPSPEPKKPESEAGSDPTSSEDEKEEKKDEKEKEKKKEKESSSESSSSDEEKKEEFKKTAEELKQEAVMKGRNKDLEKMKEDVEERRRKVVEAARSLAEKAEETAEETAKAEEAEKEKAVEKAEEAEKETATGKAEETEVDEERRDQEERRRLKTDFDIYTQSLWPVITTDVPEEPQKIRVGLPSQDLERQFNLLREITLKPVSSLPDRYGLRVRELKERVEESVIESEESLSILNDDVKQAAKRVSEAQEELKSYVKELEKELERKVKQKEALIKEAETDYQAARANVEAVEVAKMACEHFGSLLTNTDICLGEMKDAFPELQRLYERPNEAVVQQCKTLSELMAKVKERKRGDSMSAAGTPAQGTPVEKKEEKKPVAKKMPEDIKKKQMMKDYEEKQDLLKKKLEEAKAAAESIGRQRPSEPEGEPKKRRTPEKLSQKGSDDERNLENVDKKWLMKYEDKLHCFWCKATGHKAADCWKMYEEAKRLKADIPQTIIQGRHLFCGNCPGNCYVYLKKIQCQDMPYLGCGSHSPDICFHRKEVEKFLDNEGKASDKPKAPNPSWGLERMKPKASVPEDVKSSGEEKAEEKRRKKADQAKGSSRDPPKEEKKKKEKKEKKRRASDSSEIIEGAAKVQKRKEMKSDKDQTSDLE